VASWGEEEGMFGGDGHVRGIDGSDGFLDVNICPDLAHYALWIGVVYRPLALSTTLKKKGHLGLSLAFCPQNPN